MKYSVRFFLLAFAAATSTACSKSSPAQPSGSTSSVDASLTASIGAPRPLQPANNAQIRNLEQPVTLTVANGVVSQSGVAGVYTFEVATDASFGTKAQTKADVAEGGGGQTGVRLDALPAGRDYYWHARTTAGGTVGVFGPAFKFTIGPAIVLSTPQPISPLTGAQVGARPALRVANVARQGPAGPVTYKFEISTASTFASLVATATVPEGVNETAYTPSADLPINTTFFWRATALDTTNGIASAPSATQILTTSLAIDLSKVIVSYRDAPSAAEVSTWPQTGTIIAVEQDGNPAGDGPMCISFTTSREWPNIPFFGDPSVPVYANQWYFANIGGQWYAGPGEYLRAERGFCKTGQATDHIGPDGGWNTVMASWAPRAGELVGYMMSTPSRNWPGMHSTNERSNIVVQPWRDTSVSAAVTASKVRR